MPAMGYSWLTLLYDPLVRWTTRERAFKQSVVDQLGLRAGQKLLDVGCGTGTLLVALKKCFPNAKLFGHDGDGKVLNFARRKAVRAGTEIALTHGMSYDLPYANEFFDTVVTSLLLHHLSTENKRRTLKEIFRVLKPGGWLHVADWGKPDGTLMRLAFFTVQVLDGFATTGDNLKGLIGRFLADSGFEEVEETSRFKTLCGTLSIWRARRPQESSFESRS